MSENTTPTAPKGSSTEAKKTTASTSSGKVSVRQYVAGNQEIHKRVEPVITAHLRKAVGAMASVREYDAEYTKWLNAPRSGKKKKKGRK